MIKILSDNPPSKKQRGAILDAMYLETRSLRWRNCYQLKEKAKLVLVALLKFLDI